MKILKAFLLVIGVLIASACAPVTFVTQQSVVPNSVTLPPQITAVSTIKPALAVRGLSCVMCHAQISSNVITDFGYGDPEFFVNQNAALYSVSGQPLSLDWYGNYDGAWQGASITGNIYVPQVSITDSQFMNSLGGAWSQSSIDLPQLMALNFTSYYNPSDNPSGSMIMGIAPQSGTQPVQEVSDVYIGAPSKDQLLSFAPDLASNGIQPVNGGTISGLSTFSGTGGNYISNGNNVINCFGDIVVNGTLFLNNVIVNTDDNGCRLMVTQSVFIQGPVNYSNSNGSPNLGNQNLQISSARGIFMGFSVTTLTSRLGDNRFNDSEALVRETQELNLTNAQWNQLSLSEAGVLGSLLIDANIGGTCPSTLGPLGSVANGSIPGTSCYYVTGDTQNWFGPYQVINYNRLVLNAPDVESRYIGQFNGVVISEIALFAVGALDFQYDSTFNNVAVLPLLGTSVLDVEE